MINVDCTGLCRGWIFRRQWLAAAATPASLSWVDRACFPLAIGGWPPVPRRTRRDRRRRSRRNAGRDVSRTGRLRNCRYHRNPTLRRWRSIGTRAVLCRIWWNNEPKEIGEPLEDLTAYIMRSSRRQIKFPKISFFAIGHDRMGPGKEVFGKRKMKGIDKSIYELYKDVPANVFYI